MSTLTSEENGTPDRDRMRYFAANGSRLSFPQSMRNEDFATRFPGATAKRYDSFHRWVGRAADGSLRPVVRIIDYKVRGSKHKCDARCLGAKGSNCECSCGGKNHGAGFDCATVAA